MKRAADLQLETLRLAQDGRVLVARVAADHLAVYGGINPEEAKEGDGMKQAANPGADSDHGSNAA